MDQQKLKSKWSELIKAISYNYLREIITQYASKMKLWEGTDLLELLSIDKEVRRRGLTVVETLYRWPWSGTSYNKMYKQHRELRMPFHFIPSCSRFKALLSPYDWIFAIFGRAIRGKGSGFEIRNWRSGPANKFLFGMFLQLGRHRDRGEGDKYWKCGWRLMKSHAYQVSAFNYTHKNWERNMDLKTVNKVMLEVKRLVATRATSIDFKRVYIPKANGKLRPLGVPSLSWRVYLHMLNNLVVWNRIGTEGSQHAYFPGRGVHTAWGEIFERIESPNIYEFDLTGFFDNVDLTNIRLALQYFYSLPASEAKFFNQLNRSIVKLAKEDLLPEPDRRWVTGNPNPDPERERYAAIWADKFQVSYHDKYKRYGVPQGAATSCSLSTIAIHEVTDAGNINKVLGREFSGIVMYADDGVIFLERAEDLPRVLNLFVKSGVSLNEEKSGWVKKNGKWLTDLKFCGIKYSGIDETIKASTREGATLEFGLKEQFLSFLLNKREEILLGGSAGHLNSLSSYKGISIKSWVYSELTQFFSLDRPQSLLFKGRWSGYFLSSLYCDSWDRNIPANTELLGTSRHSWVRSVWPWYRRKCLEDLRLPLLENKLKDLVERLVLFGGEVDKQFEPPQDVLNPRWSWDSLMPVDFEVNPKGSVKCLTRSSLKEKVRNLSSNIRGLSNLKEELRLVLLGLEHFFGVSHGFVTEVDSQKYRSPSKFNEETLKKIYSILGLCLEINIYNASSFACDSLLRDFPFEIARHGYVTRLDIHERLERKAEVDSSLEEDLEDYDRGLETLSFGVKTLGAKLQCKVGPRYQFYYSTSEGGIVVKDEESQVSAWEKVLPELTKKLKQKIVTEFKRNFRVGPLSFVRGYATIAGVGLVSALGKFHSGRLTPGVTSPFAVPSSVDMVKSSLGKRYHENAHYHNDESYRELRRPHLPPVIYVSPKLTRAEEFPYNFFVGSFNPSLTEVAIIRCLSDLDNYIRRLNPFLFPLYGFLMCSCLGHWVEVEESIPVSPVSSGLRPYLPVLAKQEETDWSTLCLVAGLMVGVIIIWWLWNDSVLVKAEHDRLMSKAEDLVGKVSSELIETEAALDVAEESRNALGREIVKQMEVISERQKIIESLRGKILSYTKELESKEHLISSLESDMRAGIEQQEALMSTFEALQGEMRKMMATNIDLRAANEAWVEAAGRSGHSLVQSGTSMMRSLDSSSSKSSELVCPSSADLSRLVELITSNYHCDGEYGLNQFADENVASEVIALAEQLSRTFS